MVIGCHLSPSKGYSKMADIASTLGADTFQFFLRNPRGGCAKELNTADVEDMLQRVSHPLIAHAPYTLNPCSSDKKVYEFAKMVLSDDLDRMLSFCGCYYNLHPGSHGGSGNENGIEKTSKMLMSIIPESLYGRVLIETMAGQGSEIGKTFEEIGRIVKNCKEADVGVCLDTCHIYAAGYDIVNNPEKVLEEFDQRIGLSKLRAIHVNDSLFPLGSHRDRHAAIGKGHIGLDAAVVFINMEPIRNLPMVLETPHENIIEYADEIALLKENRIAC